MSAAEAQLKARNILIENASTTSILCRVSYQKSAISQQNLRGFSKLITENKQSHGKGANFKIGIPQFVEFGVGFNVEHAQEQQRDATQFDQAEVELMVSQFNEDGWIPVQSQKQRRFAIQGQIAHISALGADGKLILHNWNTMGTHYIYDGTDFEEKSEAPEQAILAQSNSSQVKEVERTNTQPAAAAAHVPFEVVIVDPRKLNESAEKKSKKAKKKETTATSQEIKPLKVKEVERTNTQPAAAATHVPFEVVIVHPRQLNESAEKKSKKAKKKGATATSQEIKPLKQNTESSKGDTTADATAGVDVDDDDESFSKIASLLYPCCCADATMNNSFYAFFGVGFILSFLSFCAVIWNALSLWLFVPCHYTAVVKKSWLMFKCEAMPFSFKYRRMQRNVAADEEDEAGSNLKYCNNPCGICWTSFIWFLWNTPLIGAHIFCSIGFFLLGCTFPYGNIHFQMAKLRCLGFTYDIQPIN